jgi:hypothetical protein
MGVYVYTLRKKTITLQTQDGPVKARLCSFAYKPLYSYFLTPINEETQRRQAAYLRGARNAFDTYHGGYVVVVDNSDIEGAHVYRDMTQPTWTDTANFPGTPVGVVKIVGKRLHLAQESNWLAGGVVNDRLFKYRTTLKDGTFQDEVVPCD